MFRTREQSITNYVKNLTGSDLVCLIHYMNANDSCFEDYVYYDMDSFDEVLASYTPLEIAQMVYFGEFNPNDDYFHFNAYGNLESADWQDVKVGAEDLVDDIIDYLVKSYSGDTPWSDLDTLVSADDDAIFNEDFEEVDEDEQEEG